MCHLKQISQKGLRSARSATWSSTPLCSSSGGFIPFWHGKKLSAKGSRTQEASQWALRFDQSKKHCLHAALSLFGRKERSQGLHRAPAGSPNQSSRIKQALFNSAGKRGWKNCEMEAGSSGESNLISQIRENQDRNQFHQHPWLVCSRQWLLTSVCIRDTASICRIGL